MTATVTLRAANTKVDGVAGAGAAVVWGAAEVVDGVAPSVTLTGEIRELRWPPLVSRPCRPKVLMLAMSGAHLPFGA